MRTRYRFLLLIATLALFCLHGIAQTSSAQRPKTQPNRKPKATASGPVAKAPDPVDPFADALRRLLVSAPDGFLSLRTTKRESSTPAAETWDTDIRFPDAFGNCLVSVISSRLSTVLCGLQDKIQLTLGSQDTEAEFEHYCDKVIRLLPADWTVNLDDLDSFRQQIYDREVTFIAPDSEKMSVRISRLSITHSIDLWAESGNVLKATGGQPVGQLRDSVRSGEPVIATIREKGKLYNSGILKAEMLFHLNRYREVAETCSGLSLEAWFCKQAKEGNGIDPYEVHQSGKYEHLADPYELYQAGKYEEALVAATVAIQKSRYFGTKDGWALLSQYQQRALINAALGQLEPALQDFNTAVAIKASLPANQFDGGTLELQEAIVLYMYGALAAGEQTCAQAMKTTSVAFLVTNICEKMQKAGVGVAHFGADAKTGGKPATTVRYPNIITISNPSELDVDVKIVGPSSQGFTLVRGKIVSLAASAGEYRTLLRYAKSEGVHIYPKGVAFRIVETSGEHSETRITLPKHPTSASDSQKLFEQAQIAVTDRPVSEVPNAAGANSGFRFVRAITGSEETILSLSFSQDSKMLTVTSFGNIENIRTWDVDSGKELRNSPLNSGREVVFSPDGKFLARQRKDHSHFVIELLAPANNTIVSQLGSAKDLSMITFSPDSRRLAFWSLDTIQVADVSNARTIYSITSKKDTIRSVAFSPNGHWLASTGKNGIVLWDATNGKWLKDFGAGEFAAFSRDGNMIATASSQNIALWNLVTGQIVRTLAGKAPVVFSRDGRWLASRSADGHEAMIWDSATGEEVATLGDPSDDVTEIALSPDGQWLASGSEFDTVWLWRRPSSRTEGAQASTQHEKNMLPAPLRRENSAPGSALNFEVLYRHSANDGVYGHLSISKAGLEFKTEIDPAWEFNASCWEIVEANVNHDRNDFHIKLLKSETRNFTPYVREDSVMRMSGPSVMAKAKALIEAISSACGQHR